MKEDIIRMAREAGLAYGSDEKPLGSVTRFAALVAAAAKAEENEELRRGLARMAALYEKAANDRDALFEKYVASAIRARGNK